MAIKQDGPEITLKAAGNLSTYQFHIMKMDSDGKVEVADDANQKGTTSEPMIGILQNKPDTEDEPAVIAIGGVSKLMSDAAIDEGDCITCSEDGTDKGAGVPTTTDGDHCIGYALTSVGDGEIFEVLIDRFFYNTATS